MFTALLDTSVLWPSFQRDFLLSLAIEGLYRPIWSQAVLDELTWAETAKRVKRGAKPHEAEEASRRLIEQMSWAFDDACVQGWEPLVGSYGLSDPDDEHLVAAAVVGGAGAIVSDNLRDLPADKLPPGVEAVSAARFALDAVSVAPPVAVRAVETLALRYQHPPRSTLELLDTLRVRYGMGNAVDLILEAMAADNEPSRTPRRMRMDMRAD